jgi:DinB superfamily
MRPVLVFTTCVGSVSATAHAQAPDVATLIKIEPAKSLDAVVTGLEEQLVPLAEAMPADKYTFAPSNDQFKSGSDVNYKGVRACGQQLAHIIQANDFFFLGVQGIAKPDAATTANLAAIGKLTQKDDLLKALKESFASAHAAVATLTSENAWDHAGRGVAGIFGEIGGKNAYTVYAFSDALWGSALRATGGWRMGSPSVPYFFIMHFVVSLFGWLKWGEYVRKV